MNRINPEQVAKRYNALETIIDDDDHWHKRTKANIHSFVTDSFHSIPNASQKKILNAGSAGYSYGLPEKNMIHIDVADKHLSHLPNAVVSDIQKMPFEEGAFDVIICVGSVLNYCDPILVMDEFSRVLKSGGYLIIEFENSYTFELLFKKGFNQSTVFIETFFDAHGDKESIWYFSEQYISNLLKSYQYLPVKTERFHILSPLLLRMTNDASFSSRFQRLDKIFRWIPGLRKFSSNVIGLYRQP